MALQTLFSGFAHCNQRLRATVAALCLSVGLCHTALPQAPQPPPAEAAWQRLQQAAWVSQGAKQPRHLVYVIADANCPFCHDLWLALQPLYARQLQVRYVMVGILSTDSPGKAAAILEAPDPSRALDRNEKRWARLPDDLGGGVPPVRKPRPATLAALESNERLMHELGIRGTPGLIYRDGDHVLHVIQSSLGPGKLKSIVAAAAPD